MVCLKILVPRVPIVMAMIFNRFGSAMGTWLYPENQSNKENISKPNMSCRIYSIGGTG